MKAKIEIKNRWTGKILFEFETENNTIKKTLLKALESDADLRDADLRGADLRDADLRDADLRDAVLRDADLTGAVLTGEKIKTAAVFTGLYHYVVIPYITESGTKRIKMGCYNRTLEEWESDFWNNPNEFPNDGSVKSHLRMMAFETAKAWFKIIEK